MMCRKISKFIILLAVAATLLVPVNALAMLKVGQPLPGFDVTTPSGQRVTNQNYSGRVLLLSFSTDYCGACKKAIPSIGKLAGSYSKREFYVLGLYSGFGIEDSDLNEYIKSYGVSYPMALFEQKFASDQFGMISVPYFLLVSKKGTVAGMYNGFSDGTMKLIEDQVKKLLAE